MPSTVKSRILKVIDLIIYEKRKGVQSKTDFCDVIGISRQALTNIEKEENRGFTVEHIQTICKEFGISPTYIILGSGPVDLVKGGDSDKKLEKIRKILNS